jgi:hypothetical protein
MPKVERGCPSFAGPGVTLGRATCRRGHGITGAPQHAVDGGQNLFGQFAAEFDVHAAPGHVGGDGHRAEGAGAGDNLTLLGVFAGVQHLMGHAALQDGLQTLGILLRKAQNRQQAGQVGRFFGVEGQAEFAGDRPQVFGPQTGQGGG